MRIVAALSKVSETKTSIPVQSQESLLEPGQQDLELRKLIAFLSISCSFLKHTAQAAAQPVYSDHQVA